MAYQDYQMLKCRSQDGVLFITIDNPPINLLTPDLSSEIYQIAGEVSADNEIKVIVFDSANEDFFIAHYDVETLLLMSDQTIPPSVELHEINKTCEAFRHMPKVSIAKIEGRTRGGGSEFTLGLDMRFGALGKAILGQPEVALGIIPGGGGTQRLHRLMGQSRALEVVLGCADFTADVAEKYGYINRALPPDEIGPFVESLALQIASFPAETIAIAKNSVQNAARMPLNEGLFEETSLFLRTLTISEAKKRMKKFMELGGQTREGELDVGKMYQKLNKD